MSDIYRRRGGKQTKVEAAPKRRPDGRIVPTEVSTVTDPETQKRVLHHILDNPHISNGDLAERVFGDSSYTQSSQRKYVKDIKTILARRLQPHLLRDPTPKALAKVSLVEGSRPLGEAFAERAISLHKLTQEATRPLKTNAAARALNPETVTPPHIDEVNNAVREYIRFMTEYRGSPTRMEELNKKDIMEARRRAMLARVGVLPNKKEYSLLEKRYIDLVSNAHREGAPPIEALSHAGITGAGSVEEMLRLHSKLKTIEDYANLLRGIHGEKDFTDVFVRHVTTPSTQRKVWQTDWSKKENRVALINSLLDEGSDPMKLSSRKLPPGLLGKFKRERGMTDNQVIAELLHEAGLINEEQKRLRSMRRRTDLTFKSLLQRADPELTVRSHVGHVDIGPDSILSKFKDLQKRLKNRFSEVDRGKRSLVDVSDEFKVGVRGMQDLYDTYKKQGDVVLWAHGMRGKTIKTPQVKRDFLSLNDLAKELSEPAARLQGIYRKTSKKPPASRVQRNSDLELVHQRLQELINETKKKGGDSDEAARKIARLMGAIEKIPEGKTNRMVFVDGGRVKLHVDLPRIHSIASEMHAELKARKKHTRKPR